MVLDVAGLITGRPKHVVLLLKMLVPSLADWTLIALRLIWPDPKIILHFTCMNVFISTAKAITFILNAIQRKIPAMSAGGSPIE